MIDMEAIRQNWDAVSSKLDGRYRRMFAAAEVQAAVYGALKIVPKINDLTRSTINRAEDDLNAAQPAEGRVRRPGG